jgi:hypothetical protein
MKIIFSLVSIYIFDGNAATVLLAFCIPSHYQLNPFYPFTSLSKDQAKCYFYSTTTMTGGFVGAYLFMTIYPCIPKLPFIAGKMFWYGGCRIHVFHLVDLLFTQKAS